MFEITWQSIWSNRMQNAVYNGSSLVGRLIALDGFDSAHAAIPPHLWHDYVLLIRDRLMMSDSDSVFEVGCGAGAFIFALASKGHQVGGIDYSEALVNEARRHLPDADVTCCEASNFDTSKKYDFVISNSVFSYFPDLAYATTVIERMLLKAKTGIAILDVPNLELKEESEQSRRSSIADYDTLYQDIVHRYYEKQFFQEYALRRGCKISIIDQSIPDYHNGNFRFNCFFRHK
jgi:trans-aconitate methyltransferase